MSKAWPQINTGRGSIDCLILAHMSRKDAEDLERMLSRIAAYADSSYSPEEIACARQMALIIRNTASLGTERPDSAPNNSAAPLVVAENYKRGLDFVRSRDWGDIDPAIIRVVTPAHGRRAFMGMRDQPAVLTPGALWMGGDAFRELVEEAIGTGRIVERRAPPQSLGIADEAD